MHIELSSDFGYVILVAIAFNVMIMWLSIEVSKARKKFNVQYPAMYSDKEPIFNCYQRAHQNTLEVCPAYFVTLVFGGLGFPKLCAAGGFLYLLGRIFYAKGYHTGDPAKRMRGAFGYIGFFLNFGCSVIFGLQMIGIL